MSDQPEPQESDSSNEQSAPEKRDGHEVQADDPGVPNDPPGPDVPEAVGGTEVPDVPLNPGMDQPEGTDDVDGADHGHGDISEDEGEPD